ncbi:type I-E CRISPR-associated protein Cse1/CasA [Methylobacterium sp. WL122]|nr:type I-E CRISPR-associated protein Cse1/CasA [Methylobacterium sp. WL122]
MPSLLDQPAIRVTTDRLSLSGVLAGLARDEIASFPALRPHQRHAWHAFLVQVGALALWGAGRETMPEDEPSWRELLRGLTPEFSDDEPWSLVSAADRPALLQPPIPGGLKDLKNRIETPDALDMLVTSKNHDLKQAVMWEAEADDWLFALVTLQTMEGFLGAGNYGVSRMNGGFANRPALGVEPSGWPGVRVRRDIEHLLALRHAGTMPPSYADADGLALVWLRPWDGIVPLRQVELDPWYVEICRRVRLIETEGRITAQAGSSKAARIVPVTGGVTGDPWAPTLQDKEGLKVLTVDAGGFGYRRMVRLLFGRDGHEPSPLSRVSADDAATGLTVLARALTRGQGKTEGFHERRVPVSKVVIEMFSNRQTEPLAAAATERVKLAGEIQNRVLKPALYALFENGPDQVDYKDNGAEARARDFLAKFERAVDATFFDDLWREFEPGASLTDSKADWVGRLLHGVAWPLVVAADRSMSKGVGRRWRALARAEGLFWSAARRNKDLQPYWREVPRDDAA